MQRYRRKLSKQGVDSHTITKLISSRIDTRQLKTDEASQQNEQTNILVGIESILCPTKRIKKKKKKSIDEQRTIVGRKKTKSNESVSKNIHQGSVKINNSVDYGTILDEIISQISSTAFNKAEKLISFINEDEKIKFIHHYTSFIDRLSYVQLQEFQWKYYHDIVMA